MQFAVIKAVDFVSADLKYFPYRNVVVYPACSYWLIDSKDSRNVGV